MSWVKGTSLYCFFYCCEEGTASWVYDRFRTRSRSVVNVTDTKFEMNGVHFSLSADTHKRSSNEA